MPAGFQAWAQEMVEATSRLVSGRTINMMDTKGIIIASTETQRIGTFHKGAAEAAVSGHPVYITRESVALYPGAKEGCNMPLYDSEHVLVGVVGIYGDPDEVKEAAHLLAVYTAQYFAQKAQAHQQRTESELRSRLLQLLLAADPSEFESIGSLCQALQVKPELPARMLLVQLVNPTDALCDQRRLNRLSSHLFHSGFLVAHTDLACATQTGLVILKSGLAGADESFLARLHDACGVKLEEPLILCAGEAFCRLREAGNSYKTAVSLSKNSAQPIRDIENAHCCCELFLAQTGQKHGGRVQKIRNKAESSLGADEFALLTQTALCYYNLGSSVTQAAQQLHIHKNTLQYRLHRLWDELGIAHCSRFEREYLVRLCAQTLDKALG